MARCFLDNLNRTSLSDTESAKGYFRTVDIPIAKIYRNDMNDYSLEDIRQLADSIAVQGLLSSLAVVHDPLPGGTLEYRLISGERRWLALQLLVSEGHTEFLKATCQVLQKGSRNQECVALILANTQRNKTPADRVFEYETLKRTLEQMRAQGEPLMGADLSKGRIRDHIGRLLGECDGTLAALEKISNGLTSELRQELDTGNMGFTAAKKAAALPKQAQKELLEEARQQERKITPAAVQQKANQVERGTSVSQCDTKEKATQKTVESEEDTQAQADKRQEETVRAIRVIRRLVAEAVGTGKVTKEEARAVRSLLEGVERVTL